MKYNAFKKSGITVSEISFGCMSLKSNVQDNDYIINTAIDSGITLFDTADLYEKGENEILVGKALKNKRKDVVLSTKVGNRWRNDSTGWDWCPTKEYILDAVNKSLKRLNTDYIDIYLLHGGTQEDPKDEILEAFEILMQKGKIKSYGISSIRPNIIRQYAAGTNISAVITQYSLLDRRPEEETLDLLLQNNIGVMARGAIAGGLLIDKPVHDYLGIPKDEIAAILKLLKSKLPLNKTKHEAAVKYVLSHPSVVTAVAGTRTVQQLIDIITVSGSVALSNREINELKTAWKGNLYTEHRE